MARDYFRELNVYRPITLLVKRSGSVVDLSSVPAGSCKFSMREVNTGTIVVNHQACTYNSGGTDGKVKYTFTSAQLTSATAGTYEMMLEIWWATGKSENVLIVDRVDVANHWGTHP